MTSVNAEDASGLLHRIQNPCLGWLDVGGEVIDEVVLGEPAEATRVGEQMRQCRRHRSLREQRSERLAFVEGERGDIDEPDDVRRVRAERGHDLAAVGVSDDDRRAVLKVEHLAQTGDVVGERGQRELRRSYAGSPSAWRRSITPPQEEPSAQAPWTRTMLGRPFIRATPLLEVSVGDHTVLEPSRGAPPHRTILRFVCCIARRERDARSHEARSAELPRPWIPVTRSERADPSTSTGTEAGRWSSSRGPPVWARAGCSLEVASIAQQPRHSSRPQRRRPRRDDASSSPPF